MQTSLQERSEKSQTECFKIYGSYRKTNYPAKRLIHMATILVTFLMVAIFIFGLKGKSNAEELIQGCPTATLHNDQTDECVFVNNRTAELLSKGIKVHVPGLHELRKDKVPVPGGIGSGVLYPLNQFQITSSTNLDTSMAVYPNGLNLPPNWLFTTATNRSEQGVEAVGIYYGNNAGAFGIFDWSCSNTNPCPNADGTVSSAPSWRWTQPLSQLACNYAMQSAGGGNHVQNMMHYNNKTFIAANGTPPQWNNQVYLWNYCLNTWDLVYSHTYFADQKDCSIDSSCGWWGPILETFFSSPQPPLEELGFANSLLVIDNVSDVLNTANTSWVNPPSEWQTFFINPDYSWGVGSSTVSLQVQVAGSLNRVRVNQSVSYTITVKNTGPVGATNVSVAALLPGGFSFSNWFSPQGSCTKSSQRQASCQLGTLLSGQSLVTTLTGAYTTTGTKTLTATVDPNNIVVESNKSDNDSASLTTTVR